MADSVRTKTLLILIRAENLANKQMMEAATQAEVAGSRITKAFRGIQLGLGVTGLAAAGFLVESVKAASDFNSMLTKTLNNTTMTTAQMQQVGDAILKMSAQTGAPLQALATGMMHISDVGFNVADSITIMQQAMESALSTGADVGDVGQVLSATMHEFGLKAGDAAKAMDVLHLASAEGNSTLEQFVETSGKAFAMAANLNVPLTDVAASLAALSRHGIGAAQASTMISGALSKIINPAVGTSALLAKITKETGINLTYAFSTAGLQALGLQGVMEKLGQAAAKSSTDVMKLIPATRGGLAALILTGRGASDYTTILNQLNDAMAGKLTPTAIAFMLQQQTTASAVDRLTASFHVMMIEVGQQLIPALNTLLARVAPFVTVLGVWVTTHAKLATEILVVVSALGLLSGGMALLEVVLGPLAGVIASVGAPLLAIAAAAGVLYEAWTHDWGGIQEKTQAVWGTVKPVFSAMGQAVASLHAAFNTGGMSGLFSALPGAASGVGESIRTLAEQLSGAFAAAFSRINWPDVITTVTHGLFDVFNGVGAWLQQTGLPLVERGIGGIGDAFSHIDWGKIGSDILATLDGWKNDIEGIDWSNVWGKLKTSFTTAVAWVKSLDWGGWAQTAIGGLQTALNTIGAWITGPGVAFLRNDVLPWIGALWQWVAKVTAPLLTALGGLLGQLGNWIAAQPGVIAGDLKAWAVEFGSWVMNKGWPALLTALQNLATEFGKWIVLISPPVLVAALTMWAFKMHEWVLKDALPALLKDGKKLVGDFAAWITGPAGKEILDAAKTWAGKIVGGLGDVNTILFNAGSAIISGLVSGMVSATSMLLGEIDSLIGVDLKDPFNGMVQWFGKMGTNIMNALIAGIKSLGSQLESTVKANITDTLKNIPNGLFHLVTGLPSIPGVSNQVGSGGVASFASNSIGGALPGMGIGTQNITVQVHVNGSTVTTSGDQTGVGDLIGQAIVDAFKGLKQASQSSNSVTGHTPLGGTV